MDNIASKGRVEIFYNGTWGSVCHYGWDLKDANVVCRQLGLGVARTVYHNAGWGGRIKWMYNGRCAGNERSLIECGHGSWGFRSCSYAYTAGVACSRGKKNGDIGKKLRQIFMSKFARSGKNCEKLEKSQFLLKLITSSVRGDTRVPRKNYDFCNFCYFSKNCAKLEKSQFLLLRANLDISAK